MRSDSSPKRPFWRISVRQLLVLCVLMGALLASLAPQVRSALDVRKARQADFEPSRRQGALNRAILERQGAERVRQAMEAGAYLTVGMGDGTSPLHCAITLGQCETVEVLLQYEPDVERIGSYDSERYSSPFKSSGPPLFAAIDCKQPVDIKSEMVRILVARGADIRREVYGIDLMEIAIQRGDDASGDLLRTYGLPYGPREMAAFNRIEELRRAVQESPDLLHQHYEPFELGEVPRVSTLLGIALRKNHREMVRMLIDEGAPIDAVAYDGQSPLHMAATYSGDPELIRLLIAHGADVNAVNDDGRTPLAATQDWMQREPAKAALIEAGAK